MIKGNELFSAAAVQKPRRADVYDTRSETADEPEEECLRSRVTEQRIMANEQDDHI